MKSNSEMKRLIAGTGVSASESCASAAHFCDFSAFVKKGHEECGDSAFVYCDREKFAAGVFDGVSGEPGAASASSQAAAAALESLANARKTDEKALEDAVAAANRAVNRGYTTAALVLVARDGSFAVAGVGDSPVYGINSKGGVEVELPLGRAVGDGDSVMKLLHFRNLVTSVLGRSGTDIAMHSRSGKLEKGEAFILASDGLSDNLFFGVKAGYVHDTAGTADLKSLVGRDRNPRAITRKLARTVAARLAGGRVEREGSLLVPKQDDLAIVALRFK